MLVTYRQGLGLIWPYVEYSSGLHDLVGEFIVQNLVFDKNLMNCLHICQKYSLQHMTTVIMKRRHLMQTMSAA